MAFRDSSNDLKNPRKLYVANIPVSMTKEGVESLFSNFGKVLNVFRSTGEKNFAMVEFESELSAMNAICSLNKKKPLNMFLNFAQHKSYDKNNDPKDATILEEMLRNHRLNYTPFNIQLDEFADDAGSRKRSNSCQTNDSSKARGSRQNNHQRDERDSGNSRDNNLATSGRPAYQSNGIKQYHHFSYDHRQNGLPARRIDRQNYYQDNGDFEVSEDEIENNYDELFDLLHEHIINVKNWVKRQVTSQNLVIKTTRFGRQVSLKEREQNKVQYCSGGSDRCFPAPLISRKLCIVCEKMAHQTCADCLTPYCSRQCQLDDWDQGHHDLCSNVSSKIYSDRDGPLTSNSNMDIMSRDNYRQLQSVVQRVEPPRYSETSNEYNSKMSTTHGRMNNQRNSDCQGGQAGQRHYKKGDESSGSYDRSQRGPQNDSWSSSINYNRYWQQNDKHSNSRDTFQLTKNVTPSSENQDTIFKIPPPKKFTNEVDQETVAPLTILQTPITGKTGRPTKAQVFDQDLGSAFPLVLVAKGKTVTFRGYTLSNADIYESLLQPLADACLTEEIIESPESDEFVSVLLDEAWYRAVYSPPQGYALIDMGQFAAEVTQVRTVPTQFKDILEYACELKIIDEAKFDEVKVGSSYICKLVAKSANFITADIYPSEMDEAAAALQSDRALCQAKMRRWFLGSPKEDKPVAELSTYIPESTHLLAGEKMLESVNWLKIDKGNAEGLDVHLLHFAPDFGVFLRSTDAVSIEKHETVIQNTAIASLQAPSLPSSPEVGDAVIAKFVGEPFRAVVLSADADKDLYKVVYIDYGNEEFISVRDMSVLPAELSPASVPTLVSRQMLKGHNNSNWLFKPRAALNEYMSALIDGGTTLKCTVYDKGEAVLKNVASSECVNIVAEQHQQLEWKKQKDNKVDILSIPCLLSDHLEDCVGDLRPETFLEVIHMDLLDRGIIEVRPLQHASGPVLFLQIKEYCEDEWAGQQYVPQPRELCFVNYQDVWKRAVCCEDGIFQLVDEGYKSIQATFRNVRKAVEDFIKDCPRLSFSTKVRDFPTKPSDKVKTRTASLLSSMGVIKCDSLVRDKDNPSLFIIKVPALMDAVKE